MYRINCALLRLVTIITTNIYLTVYVKAKTQNTSITRRTDLGNTIAMGRSTSTIKSSVQRQTITVCVQRNLDLITDCLR